MPYGLSDQTLAQITSVLAAFPEVERAIIYGSRAKGRQHTAADIDLTLQGAQLTLSRQYQIENCLDDLLLPYKIDLSSFHQIDNPELLDHIKRVGKVIYQRTQ